MPLLKRSRDLWLQLNKQAGKQIFFETGGIYLNPPNSGDREEQAAIKHNLAHEILSAEEIRTRFPAFQVPDGWTALYEEAAGLIVPEWAIKAHAELARENGAELRENVKMESWRAEDDCIRVETSCGESLTADRLVITAGAWA